MGSEDEAEECIKQLNGLDLNGRKIRVDYSMTVKPHQPTPGEYRACPSLLAARSELARLTLVWNVAVAHRRRREAPRL